MFPVYQLLGSEVVGGSFTAGMRVINDHRKGKPSFTQTLAMKKVPKRSLVHYIQCGLGELPSPKRLGRAQLICFADVKQVANPTPVMCRKSIKVISLRLFRNVL